MEIFKEALLIKISTPIYALVIGTEMIVSAMKHKKIYTLKDTLTNIYFTSLNLGLDILLRTFCLFVLSYFFQFHFFKIDNIYLYWFVLLLLQDLAFYTEHWVDHNSRFFWAVHVTHHSSEQFNLTTGFRSSVFQPLYRYVFFIPITLMGFEPMDIMFMYSATQIYGILIHTQYINKLGFLEYFMATPSHHRVHHGSNLKYLDRNMGMVFIVWDKLFGTFTPEDEHEPVVFGLTHNNVNRNDPFDLVFHEWKSLFKVLKQPLPIRTRLAYIFMPPGWSHDGSSKTAKQLRAEQQKNS